jgi:hypothetical protein
MNRRLAQKIANNIWILIIVFALTMGGLGVYMNGIAEFNTSRLYQTIFILSFGSGEIFLILVQAILMVENRIVVVRRPVE